MEKLLKLKKLLSDIIIEYSPEDAESEGDNRISASLYRIYSVVNEEIKKHK